MAARYTKHIFLFTILLSGWFGVTDHAQAVARTWDGGGGDNNWSTAANWSGDVVPGASDDVTFDSTSNKDAIWDSSGPGNILTFTLTSAYTGKLTIQKSSITVLSSWSYAGAGTSNRFDAGTSTLSMGGNATFIPGSARYYNFSWSTGGSSSLTTTGTATILGSLNVSGVGADGALIAGTFNVSGDISGNNLVGNSSSMINIVGSGTQTMISTTAWVVGSVTIDKPSGILNLVGTMTIIGGSWTYVRGSVSAGSSSLVFRGNSTFIGGSSELYNNLDFASGGSSTQTVSGTINVNNINFSEGYGTQVMGGGTFNVRGNVTTTAGGIGALGSLNIVLNGSSDQTVTSSGGYLPAGTFAINKPSGSVIFSGDTLIFRGSAFTRTSGKVNPGTLTIYFSSSGLTFTPGSDVTYYNILSNSNTTLAGNLKVANAVMLNGGTFNTNGYSITTKDLALTSGTLTANSSIIKVSGNISGAGSFTQGTSTVVLNGTNQTVSGTRTFYNLYKLLPNTTTDTLTFGAATTYTIASGGTARFMGTRGYPLSIQSSSAGSAFTLTKTGNVIAEYVSLKDSTISATTSAVASTNVSGNTSWVFTKEFVSTIRATGGDYTTLSGWEAALGAVDLTASATKVFSHSGITGTIADNSSVTGATSGATGTVVHATSTQILIKSISGTFQSGEQIRVNVSNYVTTTDTGNGAIAVAECYNDWPSALNDSVTISGETTDADNFILVVAPLGQRDWGKLKDTISSYYNGFTLKPSSSTAIVLDNQMSYTRIEGIAIDGTNATATNFRLNGTSPLGVRLLSANGVDGFSLSGGAIVTNSLAYGGTGKCFEDTTSATTNYTVYNSTAYGCAYGFQGNNTTTAITLKNVLASNNSAADFSLTNSGAKSVTYSASSDATSDDFGTTTGDRVSQTFSFVDTTNKDYHLLKKDTGGKNFGLDLSTDTTYPIIDDIDNEARPGVNPADNSEVSYDMGMDEYDYDVTQFKKGVRWR